MLQLWKLPQRARKSRRRGMLLLSCETGCVSKLKESKVNVLKPLCLALKGMSLLRYTVLYDKHAQSQQQSHRNSPQLSKTIVSCCINQSLTFLHWADTESSSMRWRKASNFFVKLWKVLICSTSEQRQGKPAAPDPQLQGSKSSAACEQPSPTHGRRGRALCSPRRALP